VARPSLSCQYFLCRIPITAGWRVVMRCGADLWSIAPGNRRPLCSRIPIVYPMLLHYAVGREAWTTLNWRFPFCARRLLALLTG
jgi:hypothetical protein